MRAGFTWAIVGVAAAVFAASGCWESSNDPCEGVRCSGHGTCISDGLSARCTCEDGFRPIGLSCVADGAGDPCEGITCSGHGTCISDGLSARCTCEDGFRPVGLSCVPDGAADADADGDVPDAADADADADADVEACADADADADADAEGDDDGGGPVCGNGVVETGEECDGDAPRSCATSCGSTGSQACVVCAWAACAPPEETCNGADDDCDGETDETFACVRGASVPCTTTCGTTGTGTCTDACAVPTGAACTPTTPDWHWDAPLPSVGAPSRRRHSVAVWTGSELIVWGGVLAPTLYGDGARYNPTTRTWRPMSPTGAPSARYGEMSVVWTGTEMIIWGGRTLSAELGDGARYDPATDTWAPVSSIGAPSARSSAATVWTGSEMIVWAGMNEWARVAYNDGGRYNPATNTWTPIVPRAGTPAPRTQPMAAWTGAEMITWGGGLWVGTLGDGARYNPSTDSWTALPSAGAPGDRASAASVWTGTDWLVWGGAIAGGQRNDGARYNPATNTWTALPSAGSLAGRVSPAAVWTGTEMIVWGGYSQSPSCTVYADGARYNPGTDSWTHIPADARVVGRWSMMSVWTGDQMIVWGGVGGSPCGTLELTDGAAYDESCTPGWGVGCTWSAPENLGPGVNTAADEQGGSIDSGGTRLYFAREASGSASADIWRATRSAGVWSSGAMLGSPPNDVTSFDGFPHISLDGLTLTFSSGRSPSSVEDVWQSTWTGSAWTAPVRIMDAGQHDHCPWVSPDGNRLYWSCNWCGGVFGYSAVLHADRSSGAWSAPTCLADTAVNAPGSSAGSPYLSADERFMAFVSDRSGTLGGADIYVSRRVGGVWQAPAHLLNGVSSSSSEEVGSVSLAGDELFFSSNRPGGYGGADIYVSRCLPPGGTVIFSDDFESGTLGENVHTRPGWSCPAPSTCISTTSAVRASGGTRSMLMPAAESGGVGIERGALRSPFRIEFDLYDPGDSPADGIAVLGIDQRPTTPRQRVIGYHAACSRTHYSYSSSSGLCAILGARSAGWHHMSVEVAPSAGTARYCVGSSCGEDAGFDLAVDKLQFTNDDLDTFIDNVVLTLLP